MGLTPQDLTGFGTVVDTQKSDTTDDTYEIRWNKEVGYNCSCVGYTASRHKPKRCKHIRRFEFKYQTEQKLMELMARGFVDFQSDGAKDNVINALLNVAKNVWKGEV